MSNTVKKTRYKKPPFVSFKLLKAVQKSKNSKGKFEVKTKSRSSTIYLDFVDTTIHVYNGTIYIAVKITSDKVGHKLGEFSPTRKYPNHKVKLNAKVGGK